MKGEHMIYFGGKEVPNSYVVKSMLMNALTRDNGENNENTKKKVNKKRLKAGDKK